MIEETPKTPPKYEGLQDVLLCHAWDIANGKAGGDYVYALQEDYIYIYEDNFWRKMFPLEFMARIETWLPNITAY